MMRCPHPVYTINVLKADHNYKIHHAPACCQAHVRTMHRVDNDAVRGHPLGVRVRGLMVEFEAEHGCWYH